MATTGCGIGGKIGPRRARAEREVERILRLYRQLVSTPWIVKWAIGWVDNARRLALHNDRMITTHGALLVRGRVAWAL